jgi:hypothetical protein
MQYQPYRLISEKLEDISLFTKFLREIYAGGKGGRGAESYGRQMILGDLIQYALVGRGCYFAVKGKQEFEDYFEY